MRSITEIVSRFKVNWTRELSDENITLACRQNGMSWNDSLLTPVVTLQLFFLQVLHGNTACQHLPRLSKLTFTAAAYCKARMRIKLEVFELLLRRCVEALKQENFNLGVWFGHRVFFMDGSSFSMPDTPALQSQFGQSGGQKPGCGFPTAHWLALLHMGTGMITRMLASPLRSSDFSKSVELHPELKAGDVLVADRGFCSFAHLCLLLARGVEAVIRIHQALIVDFTPDRIHAQTHPKKHRQKLPRSKWLRGLGINDQVVQWFKDPKSRPRWMTAEQFAGLPDTITVRELRYQVKKKRFRVKSITLVTTLLDDTIYTVDELADVFRRRWEIETNFGHLKTTMNMDVLKCKTVAGVLRELHTFALIYNLVRQVMLTAAQRQRVPVHRISFIDALRWLQTAESGDELNDLVVNPDRPSRYEPRVRKRRPKQYDLMNQTRQKLKQLLEKQ